jgi:hypothetical protein
MILRLWATEPPYQIKGKFWTIRLAQNVDPETGIGYIHKPLQQPHPPIAVPAMSRNSPSMRTPASVAINRLLTAWLPAIALSRFI